MPIIYIYIYMSHGVRCSHHPTRQPCIAPPSPAPVGVKYCWLGDATQDEVPVVHPHCHACRNLAAQAACTTMAA